MEPKDSEGSSSGSKQLQQKEKEENRRDVFASSQQAGPSTSGLQGIIIDRSVTIQPNVPAQQASILSYRSDFLTEEQKQGIQAPLVFIHDTSSPSTSCTPRVGEDVPARKHTSAGHTVDQEVQLHIPDTYLGSTSPWSISVPVIQYSHSATEMGKTDIQHEPLDLSPRKRRLSQQKSPSASSRFQEPLSARASEEDIMKSKIRSVSKKLFTEEKPSTSTDAKKPSQPSALPSYFQAPLPSRATEEKPSTSTDNKKPSQPSALPFYFQAPLPSRATEEDVRTFKIRSICKQFFSEEKPSTSIDTKLPRQQASLSSGFLAPPSARAAAEDIMKLKIRKVSKQLFPEEKPSTSAETGKRTLASSGALSKTHKSKPKKSKSKSDEYLAVVKDITQRKETSAEHSSKLHSDQPSPLKIGVPQDVSVKGPQAHSSKDISIGHSSGSAVPSTSTAKSHEVVGLTSGNYQCEFCKVIKFSQESLDYHIRSHCAFVCHVCSVLFKNRKILCKHLEKAHKAPVSRGFILQTVYGNFNKEDFGYLTHRDVEQMKLMKEKTVTKEIKPDAILKDTSHSSTSTQEIQIQPPLPAERVLTCKACGKIFTSGKEYKSHLLEHERKPYRCHLCTCCFRTFNSVKAHIYIKHGCKSTVPPSLKCQTCGKEFKKKSFFKKHLKEHRKYEFVCDFCQRGFDDFNSYKKHVEEHSAQDQFDCDICGLVFSRRNSLEKHRKCHPNTQSYSCSICGKVLKNKAGLTMHARVHTSPTKKSSVLKKSRKKEKPYTCEKCGRKFRWNFLLKMHDREHHRQNLKPFLCKICGKSFTTRNSLLTHLDSHKRKPVKGIFTSSALLARAVGKKRGNLNLCEICGKFFSNQLVFMLHQAVHL